MPDPHLVLDRVGVELGGAPILRDISLSVAEGEFVCVIGTSGGGKTTLLRTIAGLLPPASGTLTLAGAPVTGPSRRTAMVFQHFGLFPWKNVRANVAYGLRASGRPVDPRRIRELLSALGLEKAGGLYPAQLSGGMKQRVGFARALAAEPDLLLLDEPFSALDAITRESLQDEMLRIWESWPRMTALLVTHDIDEALLMGDRVIVISGPPGQVTADMPVGLPRPRDSESLRGHEEYPRLRKLLRDALHVTGEGPHVTGEAS